jgi:hypothetical protein
VFYAINKYALITKKGWRVFIRKNKGNYPQPEENVDRLTVDEMSIERTHLLLMNSGPDADEFHFNKDRTNYGNRYTSFEANALDAYFFL